MQHSIGNISGDLDFVDVCKGSLLLLNVDVSIFSVFPQELK